MASKKYDVIIERDEDGVYIARVPELPGCHTQGSSVKDVMKNIAEAIELYLEQVGDKVKKSIEVVAIRKITVAGVKVKKADKKTKDIAEFRRIVQKGLDFKYKMYKNRNEIYD
jgi:predicted RNase H-like HicB family nuclease